MKKKILYAMVFGAAAITACTDDYKDWSEPKSVAQESTVSFGDGSVASVGTIDFRTLEAEMVQVCNINAPTASVEGYAPAPDKGTLLQSVTHSVKVEGNEAIGEVGSIIHNSDYPRFLEYGTSKMKPRPWLSASLIKCQSFMANLWKEIFG